MTPSNDCGPRFPKRPHPLLWDTDWLHRAGRRVRQRLEAYDRFGPGFCLTAASVGVVELAREGCKAAFQAGACYLRRLPPEPHPDADPDQELYGYAWEPDAAHSRAQMALGFMPEFHAWVGVIAAPDGEPALPDGGLVADFAAAFMPAHAEGTGRAWKTGPVPYPLVTPAASSAGGSEGWWYYEPHPEATLVCGLMARNAAVEIIESGHPEAADLFGPVGGPPKKAADGITFARSTPRAALGVVRKLMAELPVPAGSWRPTAGVW